MMSELILEKIDVHHYGFKLQQQYELIEGRDKILPENKQLILDFINFCKIDPKIREARIIKYFYSLRRLGELVDKPFEKMDEKDITTLLSKIQNMNSIKGKPFASSSLADFRKAISKFWRWMYYDQFYGEAPPMIKRFRVSAPDEHKEPETFAKEEIEKLINGMGNIRDKTLFACLYDLGCRVGELLTRQIKHIQYTQDGDIQILIESEKTRNGHWETLFESVPYFTTWLRLHPDSQNPNAPLWTMRKYARDEKTGKKVWQKDIIVPLSYPTTRKIFYSVVRKEGLRSGKNSTIHMLRKSKATHDLADGVPISYIEARGSWKKGSRALQNCYLSIQQKDKENAYKKKYGMTITNGQKDVKEMKRCRRCELLMESSSKFCTRCGLPVDLKAASEMQKVAEVLPQLVDKEMLSEMVKRYVLEEMKKTNQRSDFSNG